MVRMQSLVPMNRAPTLVTTWAVLVLLTLMSWWLRDHALIPALAVSMILGFTFLKVFMVGYCFMEIGHSTKLLKIVFTTWCAVTCTGLIGLALAL